MNPELNTLDSCATVLIVDDKPQMRDVLRKILSAEGYAVAVAPGGDEALEFLQATHVDVVLTDLRMPGMDGFELIDRIRAEDPDRIVILMTAFGSVETAVAAIKGGATDYVSKPFQTDEVLMRIRRALDERGTRRRVVQLERQLTSREGTQGIIGGSEAVRRLRRVIEQIAPLDSTVLITGETGTGKELVARALHAASPRAKRPFVALDCSAIPEALVESELFGHERGSFTGATEAREGLFEAAADGTLFLDEVESLPLTVQAKLLRVLQEKNLRRIGGRKVIPVRARILAATNKPLDAEVRAGTFRQDLYFRLAVIPIPVPSLRERRDDIPELVQYFLDREAARRGTPSPRVTPEALARMMAHHFPGNIRELENAIHFALAFADSVITTDHLPVTILASDDDLSGSPGNDGDFRPEPLADIEKRHILKTLDSVEGNQVQAAKLLGIDRRTLYNKLKSWQDNIGEGILR